MLASTPLISEFMASNSGTILDGDGNASDWIEVYNPTAQTINLAGWHLTDNAENLDKWTFPAAAQSILDPGEYLVVFASSKLIETYIDPAGYLHTDFALSAGGEYLALTNPDNEVASEYAPTYPPQIGDVSYGLVNNSAQVTLVGPSNATSAFVPSNGALDAPNVNTAPAWTLPGYNDAAWPTSGNGVGVGFDAGEDEIINVLSGTLLPGGPIGFDLTDPEEDGVLNGTINSPGSSPGNEQPAQALDNTIFSKWLNFSPTGANYEFRFAGGERHAVNGYTLTSANDADGRDPYSWILKGSNDGVNYFSVDTRNAQNFANRFETRLYEFSNNTAYEYYKFDFKTEFGVTGSNEPNSIQIGEIELLSSGPISFDDYLDVDVEAAWSAQKTSVYQRVEFNVADPSDYAALMLEIQYDDGFVAYLNGAKVASANAPTLPDYQSNATGQREDADALKPQAFNLTAYLSNLVAGTNVLAIHLLNVSDASSDLLSLPKLTATEIFDSSELIVGFMTQPTPGSTNVSAGVTAGPIVSSVTTNPPRPAHNSDLPITARVTAAGSPIQQVQLHYRVMFNTEATLVMLDNGLGSDLLAGDGIYTAVIPESAYSAGQMVRWYVTAADATTDESRYPLFISPANSPEYLGTVVQNVGVSTTLPIFEYFVQDVAASGTEIGTRASVFYLGEFYDNVFIRRRGGNSTQGRKFEFNDGYHFLIDADLPRVDEINLNQRGSEPTYMRQVLSWELYAAAGVPASLGQAWYTRQNGAYLDVRIFVEQPDSDLLRRTGLDPEGALYKIGADGVENSVTSSTNGVNKRTRENEDNSDLQALVNGVNPSNVNRTKYVFDNIDVAAAINYIAATSIIHDNDHPHKNFHLYRDTMGTQQWTFLPWDKDLTFGINFGISGIIGNVDPYGHPLFGDQGHQKVDGQWNRMIDALFSVPSIREMYVRRLRTLMDQFLQAPGSSSSWVQTRVNELIIDLQPHVGGSSWLAEVNKITGEYLTERRQHLYVDHSINNPGYPDNAKIPNAQIGNPTIQFGTIDFNPTSGNQDQEYIQFINPNATAVDVSNWRVEGSVSHTFTPGTVIPAGGILYLAADVPSFLARTTGPRGGQSLFVQGNYEGRISIYGETLRLVAADNSPIAQVTTPGAPATGSVIMSEVHYHPEVPPAGYTITDLQLEFVELYNRTAAEVDLSNWQVSGGITYTFPAGSKLGAFSTLVAVPFDPTNASLTPQFRELYGVGSGVTLIGPYAGQLSNSGEEVVLSSPTGAGGAQDLVDAISYLDVPPWPAAADGEGSSLTRTDSNAPGTDDGSWVAAPPTPGNTPFTAPLPGNFDNDADVDGADFLAWQRGFGAANATRAQGDANGDNVVNAADLTLWKSHFGQVQVSSSSVASSSGAMVALLLTAKENATTPSRILAADLIDLALAAAWMDVEELDVHDTDPVQSEPVAAPYDLAFISYQSASVVFDDEPSRDLVNEPEDDWDVQEEAKFSEVLQSAL